jgi:hypothetical protein
VGEHFQSHVAVAAGLRVFHRPLAHAPNLEAVGFGRESIPKGSIIITTMGTADGFSSVWVILLALACYLNLLGRPSGLGSHWRSAIIPASADYVIARRRARFHPRPSAAQLSCPCNGSAKHTLLPPCSAFWR